MNRKPKVSIITVYHNRRDHVEDSIKSLLEQTYDNLDIIVIDDRSTDDTFELIQKTVENSPRVKLISNQENKGFTQTIIDTIKELDSTYIAIHGAGDISLPTRVEVQVNYMLSNPKVGAVTVDITNIKRSKFHKAEITLNDLLKKNRVTHGAVMFKKEVYDKVGGYRSFFTTRQDKDLWFRMSLITQIHFINNKLYELTSIQSSVSKVASKNGLPLFLSVFSEELIIERKKTNTDKLDLYGEKAALFFNPNKVNKLIFFNFLLSVYKNEIENARNYLSIIKIYNNSFLMSFCLYILKLYMKLWKKV